MDQSRERETEMEKGKRSCEKKGARL